MNKYYYLNSANEQKGPIDPSQFNTSGVTATTLVWAQGMTDWKPAGQVEELKAFFRPAPSAAPQPPYPPQAQPAPAYQPQPQPAPTYSGTSYNRSETYQSQMGQPVKPNNYLVWSILCTLFCCLPLGVVAIIYSSKVDSAFNAGNYAEAQNNAANAKKWALIGAIGGFVITVAYIIVVVAAGVGSY